MSSLTFRSDPPPSDDDDVKPIEFGLVVWRRPDAKDPDRKDPVEESHTFQCLPRAELSGHHITHLALQPTPQQAWAFLARVMDPADLKRLDTLLNDKQVYVDPKILDTASWALFERYAARPTPP